MTLHGLIVPFVLVPALATGCLATKDMGEEDTESATGSGSESTATTASSMSNGDTGATSSMSGDGDGTATSMPDDADGTLEMESTGDSATTGATGTDDAGSGSSSGGSGGDEADCEATGGTWEPTSCGHYECGMPPACAAVIPGCDCGPTMNFVEGTGCVEDPACLQATFDCGEIDCTLATEYCEVFHPGIPGPPSYSCNALPAACVTDPTCMCLNDEGIGDIGAQCTELQGGGLQIEFFAP